MKNLRVECYKIFSYRIQRSLTLKWLRLELSTDEIPLFNQAYPDLEVFECILDFKYLISEFESKLFKIFNFCKLKAFTFSSLRKLNHDSFFNFDLKLLNAEKEDPFKQEINYLFGETASNTSSFA